MTIDYRDPRQVMTDLELFEACEPNVKSVEDARRHRMLGHFPCITLGKEKIVPREMFLRWLKGEYQLPALPEAQRSMTGAEKAAAMERAEAERQRSQKSSRT